MRQWNFTTLEDISVRVTAEGHKQTAPRTIVARKRKFLVQALALSVALGASIAGNSQVSVSVSATPEIATVKLDTIESSQAELKPFENEFAVVDQENFYKEHEAVLRELAAIGSSLDENRDSFGVMHALQTDEASTGEIFALDEIKTRFGKKPAG